VTNLYGLRWNAARETLRNEDFIGRIDGRRGLEDSKMLEELKKFLFTLLSAFVGGSLVAWLGGYYSEKGKRKLLREEWPRMLAETGEKAFVEEMAKRLASKEDIANVLEQVRAVTRETEIIKAEISGSLWQRQWQLTEKRNSYTRLIDTLENLKLAIDSVGRAIDTELRSGALSALQEAIGEFRRARAAARLLLDPAVIEGIGKLLRRIDVVDRTEYTQEQLHSARKLITDARDSVVAVGKRELGLSS